MLSHEENKLFASIGAEPSASGASTGSPVAPASRGGGNKVGVRMTLHDEGNGDRAVTSASAFLEVVG